MSTGAGGGTTTDPTQTNPPAGTNNNSGVVDPNNTSGVVDPNKKADETQYDPSQVVIPPNPFESEALDPNISQVLPSGINQSNYYHSLYENQNNNNNNTDKAQTFLTLQKQGDQQLWQPFDFLFPAGILAKLVQVNDIEAKGFPWNDILNQLQLNDATPVVNLIGAKENQRGQFYAGIARACYNSDAVIIDSAIECGIEQYALRRGLKLIGVAPQNEIQYPKINPTYQDPNQLANGHTHLFLVNNKDQNLEWGGQGTFKNKLAVKLSEGQLSKKQGREPCQIVNILLGDHQDYMADLRSAVKQEQPILVVRGSKICQSIIGHVAPPKPAQEKQPQEGQQPDDKKPEDKKQEEKPAPPPPQLDNEQIIEWLSPDPVKGCRHLFFILESNNSEDIAQYIHFLLSVTPFKKRGLKSNFQKQKKTV